MIRKLTLTALVALGAAGAVLFLLAPPAPIRVETAGWDDLAARTIAGAYHVHTTRSDGHGDRSAAAAAAAAAGLKFVILTDHGDATRPPDPPGYINGVLVLDAVEISTDHGHLVALDMPRAPYPLGGTAEAVVEDVHRLGGFAIAAHPDSPKPTLRWTDGAAPIDGIEWINADSEWRDETRGTLVSAGLAYSLGGGLAIGSLFDRPATLDRWNELSKRGRIVALAAADAHGGPGERAEDPDRTIFSAVGIPSYDASFRALSNRVILDRPLSGDAAADARAVYGAVRAGRVFSSIDAFAAPALLDLTFESGLERASIGSVLPDDADGTIVARVAAPAGSQMSLIRDGKVVATSQGNELRHVLTAAKGSYHVEVVAPGAPGTPPVPWLVSNGIGFLGVGATGASGASGARGAGAAGATGAGAVGATSAGAAGGTGAGAAGAAIAPFPWRIEKDPSSSATLRTGETSATLEFKLGEGERAAQFVAMATDIQRQEFATIDLALAGDRAMRVSVQLRHADGRRWGRSYYVDPAGSGLRVPVAALAPIGHGDRLISIEATSLLLVVDLTNAGPGRTGTLTVRSSAFAK